MRAVTFADVLDEALALGTAPSARGDAARPHGRATAPYVANPFLFSRPFPSTRHPWERPVAPPPPRPEHRLTDAQRRALQRLTDLGASLSARFTADELRREYRRLAYRYHPDRHGSASADERERLGRVFAGATDAYRCLRAVVEVRH